MPITRRQTLLAGSGLLLAAGTGVAMADRHASRPRLTINAPPERQLNILMILTDQERHGSLLPKGLALPNHDRLFARSTRFSNMNGVSGLCSIARGTIYTGQHYQHNGVYENVPIPFANDLYPHVATLGTMMQDAGYETAYFGKWHLTRLPTTTDVGAEHMAALFKSYGFDVSNQPGEVEGPLYGFKRDGYTAATAARFISTRKGSDRPWFAAANLLNPHDIMFFLATKRQYETFVSLPFAATTLEPAPDESIYAQDLDLALPPNFGQQGDSDKPPAHELFRVVNDSGLGRIPADDIEAWRRYENYYLNCLRDMDSKLGVMLDAMDAADAWRDTIVVFTSDHGELSGAHGLRCKGNVVYRENSSVPFTVAHPDTRAGADTAALASHIDIVPTLLRFAGVKADVFAEQAPWLKGYDLGTAMGPGAAAGPGAAGRTALLYQWDSSVYGSPDGAQKSAEAFKHAVPVRMWKLLEGPVLDGLKYRHGMRGAFDGRYKFARYFRPGQHNTPKSPADLWALNDIELYDTLADPMERKNIAGEDGSADQVWRMARITDELIAREIGRDDVECLPGPAMLYRA